MVRSFFSNDAPMASAIVNIALIAAVFAGMLASLSSIA